MTSPKIEMAQLKLLRSVFACNMDFQPTDERVALAVTMRHAGYFTEGLSRAHFIQRLQTGGEGPDSPFTLEVEFAALFALDPPIDDAERNHYIGRVFPQIVFPYTREYVAETTRRGGFSPLIINHTLFQDVEEPSQAALREQEFNKWIH